MKKPHLVKALLLAASVISSTYALKGTTDDLFAWDDNNSEEITITGYTGPLTEVVIPTTVNDKPVTTIGKEAFYNNNTIQSVEIPFGVKKIGEKAFEKSIGLKIISIPNSVEIIDYKAFNGCKNLKSLTVPNSVTEFAPDAIGQCLAMDTVTFGDGLTTIEGGTFLFTNVKTVILGKKVSLFEGGTGVTATLEEIIVDTENPHYSSVEGVLFSKDTTVLVAYPPSNSHVTKSYQVPASVSTIGEVAFALCKTEEVTLPLGIKTIPQGAFIYSLVKCVSIPNSVTTIGNNALSHCDSLQSITIPNSVTTIGENAFHFNYAMTEVTLSENITSIGDWAFASTGIQEFSFPPQMTQTGNMILDGCDSLTTVIIPEGYTTINRQAFKGCTSLINITLPSTITSIERSAFYDCHSLEGINLSQVDAVSQFTFRNCSSLVSVEFPPSVTVIDSGAFWGCEGLTSLSFTSDVTITKAFASHLKLKTINLGKNVTTQLDYPDFNLKEIIVDDANSTYSSEGGVLFDKSKTTLLFYPAYREAEIYQIPDGVKKVDRNSIPDNHYLRQLHIPASVDSLLDYESRGLESYHVDKNNSVYASYEGVLYNKDMTELIYYPKLRKGDKYWMPEGVTTVKSGTSYQTTYLEQVYLPTTMNKLGDYAFQSNYKLHTATFMGDAPEFFGTGVFSYCADSFTIQFIKGAEGFTTPTWNGYPCREVDDIAIIVVDSAYNKATNGPIAIAPNPVMQTGSGVSIITNRPGLWYMRIFDALGNLIDASSFTSTGATQYFWDLHSKEGNKVSSGSYVLVAEHTDSNKRKTSYKRTIGVKE